MDRVTALLTQSPGGRVADDTLSHYPEPVEPWRVAYAPGSGRARARHACRSWTRRSNGSKRWGARSSGKTGGLSATVPTFRRDLRREADLVEEVGRLIGLDRVPETLPAVPQPGGLTETQQRDTSAQASAR